MTGTLAARGPILVLGMHRSGTSCLAGCLEECGLWLGDVVRASPHNAKGNRERRAVRRLNEAVLRASGHAWDAPPADDPVWSAEHAAERDALLADYPADRPWGMKDPRTLVTLAGWREALPHARLVATVRQPLAVARSLEARDAMPLEAGLALWTAYNERLLRLLEAERVPLVSFDAPPDAYRASVRNVASELDLAAPAGTSFFAAELRRQDVSGVRDADVPNAVLPIAARDLHAELLGRAA